MATPGQYKDSEVTDIINQSGIDLAALLATLQAQTKIEDLRTQNANIQSKINAQDQPLRDAIQANNVEIAALIAAQSKG